MKPKPGRTDTRARAAAAAFTLVELLVVIVIIGVLMGILLPAINAIRRQAAKAAATTQIRAIAQACHAYEMDYGFFPPESMAATDDGHADIDKPAESLWFFLTRKFERKTDEPNFNEGHDDTTYDSDEPVAFGTKNTGPYYSPKARELADHDGDGVPEIVDRWGYPLLYNARGGPWGDDTNNNRPFHNKLTFDLFSVGPNGATRQARPDSDFNRVLSDDLTYAEWVDNCLTAFDLDHGGGDIETITGGNDTLGTGANSLADERQADDINNWNTE